MDFGDVGLEGFAPETVSQTLLLERLLIGKRPPRTRRHRRKELKQSQSQ